jgi:protein subunit release factor B
MKRGSKKQHQNNTKQHKATKTALAALAAKAVLAGQEMQNRKQPINPTDIHGQIKTTKKTSKPQLSACMDPEGPDAKARSAEDVGGACRFRFRC